jgi:hypothetical protein
LRRALLALQIGGVVAAAFLAWLPLSDATVERYYSASFYPSLQTYVTAWSNATRFALFDVLVFVLLVVGIISGIRCLRGALRTRRVAPLGRGLWWATVFVAAMYVWFALAWGLNYARMPIESAIGYDPARVSADALRRLADTATRAVNRTHPAAHQGGFPQAGDIPPALVNALHDVERRLGRPRVTVPGRPKVTLFAHFFRASGVDGMHAPFLLETLLNPDLTPPERPAVLAHEWAHMSGYAPEADASFVGLLAALRADPGSQYSAWLAVFDHAVGQLPRPEQRAFVGRLDPGPQADRRAISERLQSRVDVVARASWETYDQYLKSQGVDEGIASYSRVVQLLLGANALEWP